MNWFFPAIWARNPRKIKMLGNLAGIFACLIAAVRKWKLRNGAIPLLGNDVMKQKKGEKMLDARVNPN